MNQSTGSGVQRLLVASAVTICPRARPGCALFHTRLPTHIGLTIDSNTYNSKAANRLHNRPKRHFSMAVFVADFSISKNHAIAFFLRFATVRLRESLSAMSIVSSLVYTISCWNFETDPWTDNHKTLRPSQLFYNHGTMRRTYCAREYDTDILEGSKTTHKTTCMLRLSQPEGSAGDSGVMFKNRIHTQ